MTLDQKQKQFWNRHAKRNKNPRDPNVSVLLGAFVSRSKHHQWRFALPPELGPPALGHPPTVLFSLRPH